jgi:large subunit ribosomal protein L32
MPLPKRRHSRERGRLRRTHYKLTAPGVVLCEQCQQPRLPHRACRACGYYKGEIRVAAKEA